jgi:outer membrane protein OmpA-like peptidoglycan-associated protein
VVLSAPALSIVATEAEFLKANPNVEVTLKGYCTPEEGRRYGPGVLAALRASKVRDELVDRGDIANTRIAAAPALVPVAGDADIAQVVIIRN